MKTNCGPAARGPRGKALILAVAVLFSGSLSAQDAGPQLDPPTLECLGAYWVIDRADATEASITSFWRKVGEQDWHPAQPLRRVETGRHVPEKYQPSVEVPEGMTLFAGSLLGLTPGTAYEWKLTRMGLIAGRPVEHILTARTAVEPTIPTDTVVVHVVPGNGGGSGKVDDPFKGIATAQTAAKPGTVFLLHAGIYPSFTASANGEPGKPIVWRAAGDGEVVIDGAQTEGKRAGRGISASDVHDVWFEDLTIRNADFALVGHEAARVVVRRCRMHQVMSGITATRNDKDALTGWFVTDNVLEGPSTWPRSKGIEEARGIQLTGSGHVIARNRVRGFADAIDTFPSRRVVAIDIHDNEISDCTDDGVELDYSHRNTRAFRNRLTNCYQGISFQPIHGGPAYAWRNSLTNICVEPFKLHSHPSGAVIVHNTVFKQGVPMTVMTGDALSHLYLRNNLFVGSEGRACNFDAAVQGGDLDFDGYVGWSGEVFLKWNGQKYATPEDTRKRAPIYRNVVTPPFVGLFASVSTRLTDQDKQKEPADLRLNDGSGAVDTGQAVPGFNDGFVGKAPDLGAYELGAPLPTYGPR